MRPAAASDCLNGLRCRRRSVMEIGFIDACQLNPREIPAKSIRYPRTFLLDTIVVRESQTPCATEQSADTRYVRSQWNWIRRA